MLSVRVVEVIPGKNVMGLGDREREARDRRRFGEIVRSKAYDDISSPLALVLGKDIGGQPAVADLAKMPHLLVAGTTGSGKSVAINAMVLSLLYKSTAEHVRLIMIDPKMLELSVYEGIPHLLAPVVTDMKQAANALRWCVVEMDRRYRLMAALGVRNIVGFNKKVREANEAGKPILDPVMMEMASMDPTFDQSTIRISCRCPTSSSSSTSSPTSMMIVGKKVEELIARLAQEARAAGIHLVLATQRPSVDVITRSHQGEHPDAYRVPGVGEGGLAHHSRPDGRRTLLGHGDMLYLPPGASIPHRCHGAFVSDQEVHRVVNALKTDSPPGLHRGGAVWPTARRSRAFPRTMATKESAVCRAATNRTRSTTRRSRSSPRNASRRSRTCSAGSRSATTAPRGCSSRWSSPASSGPLQSNGSREVLAPPPLAPDPSILLVIPDDRSGRMTRFATLGCVCFSRTRQPLRPTRRRARRSMSTSMALMTLRATFTQTVKDAKGKDVDRTTGTPVVSAPRQIPLGNEC